MGRLKGSRGVCEYGLEDSHLSITSDWIFGLVVHDSFSDLGPSTTAYRNQSYEEATFSLCNFVGSDFSQSLFENCSFIDCNLSNALVDNTKFQTCHFENCKIVGVDFSPISPILLSACFSKSNLDLCIFMEVDFRKLSFSECHITESQFVNANLKEVAFEYCDLSHSLFEGCNLEGADFSTAKNYVFSPQSNRIRQAIFSLPEVLRFLEPLDIIIK